MWLSAEIRWFWPLATPDGLTEWFRSADHGCAAGGGETRVDEYLRDAAQAELGIKRRGGRAGVEMKGLVADPWAELEVPFAGGLQLWSKWNSAGLELPADSTVAIEKQRWLRKFSGTEEIALDTAEQPLDGRPIPAAGCNVELTRITAPRGELWWSFALEGFGAALSVADEVRAAAAMLAARRPPRLDGLVASYPAWLRSHVMR